MYTGDVSAEQALSFLFSELTYVEAEVLKQPYPELKYPQVIPIDTSAPDYASSIAFKTLDFRGKPQLLSQRGQDTPMTEIASNRGSVTVYDYTLGYDYTLIEVGYAMQLMQNDRTAGINYLAEKANGTRQLIEQHLDEVFIQGDDNTTDMNTGLVNDSTVAIAATGDFLPGGSDKTITEILDGTDEAQVANELLQLFNRAVERVRVSQTNTIFRPTHILLPPEQLGQMRTYRIPNTNETLITYLEKVINITFDELLHLREAGDGGVDRMMVYTRDPKYVKGHMPMEFSLLAPGTADNLTFVSKGIVRTAGTELRIPKQHLYVDDV